MAVCVGTFSENSASIFGWCSTEPVQGLLTKTEATPADQPTSATLLWLQKNTTAIVDIWSKGNKSSLSNGVQRVECCLRPGIHSVLKLACFNLCHRLLDKTDQSADCIVGWCDPPGAWLAHLAGTITVFNPYKSVLYTLVMNQLVTVKVDVQ